MRDMADKSQVIKTSSKGLRLSVPYLVVERSTSAAPVLCYVEMVIYENNCALIIVTVLYFVFNLI